MTPEMWQRLKPLFDDAIEKPAAERGRFVDEVCGDDLELHDALHRLVNASGDSTGPADRQLFDLRNLFSDQKPAFTEGTLVLARFRIVRAIGSGGMGEVYEAIDLELGRRIALKTIRADIAGNPQMLVHFKNEVKLAQRISGPHVCRIHELYMQADSPGGQRPAFLTMEFLEGVTLADKIRESGPLPWKEVKTIALEICEGLRVMHEAGIIHRDLKSRNVMLAKRNGTVKAVIMDFGLAHKAGGPTAETATDVSEIDGVAGTVQYMAPEQFEGQALTPASDIFALGVVMYELATGQHPFPSSNTLQAAVQRGRRPAAPSAIQKKLPHRCDEIVCRCLEFDPKKRYGSAAELARDLRSGPLSITRLRNKSARVPRRVKVSAAIFVCLTVAAAVAYLTYQSNLYKPPSVETKRWYEKGLAALREGTYLQAIRALEMAVEHEKKFLLAHARLAEAWAELDFTSPAQTEMLTASVPEQESNLPDLDRKYIGAIRETLTEDFSGAVDRYKEILKQLPDEEKAYGYVDLGRAYEKNGDLKDAVASYEHAASLSPENPAPFMHLGVLKSRQMDMKGGEAAFQKAESLYEAESNLEGRAEVAYQRGYAANMRGDWEKAKLYLNTSFEIAGQIPNPQLEVRTLAQLSNGEPDAEREKQYAEQEIHLAEENQIEYWTTDGLNRLADAFFTKVDYADAEQYYLQALKQARQNQHPKLEANAEFGVASIRDQQGKWDESIPFAQEALAYYDRFGYMGLAAEATELIIRGEQGKGDTEQALKSATAQLELARKWGDPSSIEIAEESVGRILLESEKYPEALAHFEQALKAALLVNGNFAKQKLNCAYTLWNLGRYQEAEDMLQTIPANAASRPDIASVMENTRAQMFFSERRFQDAYKTSRDALAKFKGMPAGEISDLKRVKALAEAELGQTRQAEADGRDLLMMAREQENEELIARANMVLSVVKLKEHVPTDARSLADAANRYFSSKGVKESEWLSLYYLAAACKGMGDSRESSLIAKKALDTLSQLRIAWGSPTFEQYVTRPDHQFAIRELAKL
jgi:serine/threonine protein kinase